MDLECIGFVDADFARDRDRKHSIMICMFSMASNAMSWELKLKSIMALSMIKVAFIVAMHVCRKAIWLRQLFRKLKVKQNVLELHCDSQGALIILSKEYSFSLLYKAH